MYLDIIHGEIISGPCRWWRVCESAEHVATLNMSGHVADRGIASSRHGKHDSVVTTIHRPIE